MERKLKATEVIFLLGISYRTLEVWYTFKRKNPEHELAKMLPECEQEGFNRPRYWKESDIPKLIAFKEAVPHGRYGVFGEITHLNKYVKQRKERSNGEGKSKNNRSKMGKK